jgi:endonuclease G, mitochondrial
MARNDSSSGGFLFKTGLFALLAGIAYWFFDRAPAAPKDKPPVQNERPTPERPDADAQTPPAGPQRSTVKDEILPASTTGAVVRHTYYVLSYSEDHEQAEWVAYELTRERLNDNWAERTNLFMPDPEVRTESATPRDYNGSGYDRGHLCAAADMAFNETAIAESFYMSNMSPQVPAFNGGIWRELEELSRDWARKFKHLYVTTGPILARKAKGQIGFSKVTVPGAYYRILYAPEQHRAIAFVMPNEVSDRPVMDYAVSIDAVEEETGLDFFPKLLDGMNEELEGSLDKSAWPMDPRKYEKRVGEWNRKSTR